MDGTTGVVTRDNGVELCNAVVISGLDTTESGGVETALTGGRDTRVDAGGIAVPKINVKILNSSAVGDVDELKVEVDGNTTLAISDILADQLAGHKVRSDSDLGDQGAGGTGAEDGVQSSVESIASAGDIMADSAPRLKGSLVTLGFERF